ncbi:hypothetical protein KJ855_01170 [Patescibacteria group bacterium]|nr:hypothetical protein [Patescibacteria group bacterium]
MDNLEFFGVTKDSADKLPQNDRLKPIKITEIWVIDDGDDNLHPVCRLNDLISSKHKIPKARIMTFEKAKDAYREISARKNDDFPSHIILDGLLLKDGGFFQDGKYFAGILGEEYPKNRGNMCIIGNSAYEKWNEDCLEEGLIDYAGNGNKFIGAYLEKIYQSQKYLE